jgi:hypothetical protein
MNNGKVAASFRDPSGFVFTRQGQLYRQINQAYQADYEALMGSGLYTALTEKGWLVAHQEVVEAPLEPECAYRVIQPQVAPFISYPYEWSFSQLKAAALRTLAIQKMALEHDLALKDASAYNIQFWGHRPCLIDSLSFERYRAGEPWPAYRQFCQHFLAPLALMAYRDVRLNQLLRVYIDGIPLDLAACLLPGRTRLNVALATHIHLHAAAQKRYAGQAPAQVMGQTPGKPMVGKHALLGLVESLQGAVRQLKWKPQGTEWAEYYSATNYVDQAMQHKQAVVAELIEQVQPRSVWDLGANTGLFSRLASQKGIFTVAFDIDPAAVELNYLAGKTEKDANLLPLVLDLTNPSPALGWQNRERMALAERGPVDLILALALVHHLAISNNVPLAWLAEFFYQLTPRLVIEFIPKNDSQVKRLLATRQDIFKDYTVAGFERAFGQWFKTLKRVQLQDAERIIYLMEGN